MEIFMVKLTDKGWICARVIPIQIRFKFLMDLTLRFFFILWYVNESVMDFDKHRPVLAIFIIREMTSGIIFWTEFDSFIWKFFKPSKKMSSVLEDHKFIQTFLYCVKIISASNYFNLRSTICYVLFWVSKYLTV